jgi:hypothetical protein
MSSSESSSLPTEFDVDNLHQRLTHSYEDQNDLQRISWTLRSTDPSNLIHGEWIWPSDPNDNGASPFPARLTHSYDPASGVEDRATTFSTTTSTLMTSSASTTTDFWSTTVVRDDEPVVVLADVSGVLYDSSQSSNTPGYVGSKLLYCFKVDFLLNFIKQMSLQSVTSVLNRPCSQLKISKWKTNI